jgi:hypothetical protein
MFKLVLKPGERISCRFSDYGIPADAKILYVNYTAGEGGLSPIEMHGNVPARRLISNEVTLYPVPFPSGPVDEAEAGETDVNVMVSWVPRTADDESWQTLVDAFEAFAQGRYTSMVVPANVAVESALSRVLAGFLMRFVSRDRTNEFLENAATYGHQLNVLLPLIVSQRSLPSLPDNVRGALNKLRGLRNDIAHSGVLRRELDRHEAAEVLCAAVFGIHYVRFVEGQLPGS